MKKNNILLSIIIPIYNENTRLSNIEKILAYIKTKSFTSEIILVNDGSDKVYEKHIQQIIHKNKKISLISYTSNRGKGYAIKTGMLAANGKYRLFTDIDLSTPIETFDVFLPHLKKYEVVIGSRNKKGSRILVKQTYIRTQMGKTFTRLSQAILRMYVTDFTCGFKCFSDTAAQVIFQKMNIHRWGFDSEALFIAQKYGYKIQEVPVAWRNDPKSKVKIPRDIIKSFVELLRVVLNDKKGIYNR